MQTGSNGVPRYVNRKDMPKYYPTSSNQASGMLQYNLMNQKNAVAQGQMNLSNLIVVQPVYNNSVENALLSGGTGIINGTGNITVGITAVPPSKKLMTNAQIQQTLLAQGGMASFDKKGGTQNYGPGKSQPPQTLSNLLSLNQSSSKERIKQHNGFSSVSPNIVEQQQHIDREQEEATIQFLRQQILGSNQVNVPNNGKNGRTPHQRGESGSPVKLPTNGSFHQSNAVLPVITQAGSSVISSPMKSNHHFNYSNSDGGHQNAQISTKSHTHAQKALGIEGTPPPKHQLPGGDIMNSNYFKSKVVTNSQNSSMALNKMTQDDIITAAQTYKQSASVVDSTPSKNFQIAQQNVYQELSTPQSSNKLADFSSSKYNPYSVNYQYLNSCFHVQDQQQQPMQTSADFSLMPGLLKQAQNEKGTKIFKIKNSGANYPPMDMNEQFQLRRNSLQATSGVEIPADIEIADQEAMTSFSLPPKAKYSPTGDTNNSKQTTQRKREDSKLSNYQRPPETHISNLLDLINVQNAVQVSPGVSYFPVSSTINSYSGVFLGDGALQGNQQTTSALSGGMQAPPLSNSAMKGKKKRHQTINEDASSGRIVNAMQRSTDLQKDPAFQKYLNSQHQYESMNKMNSFGHSTHHHLLSNQNSTLKDDSASSYIFSSVLAPNAQSTINPSCGYNSTYNQPLSNHSLKRSQDQSNKMSSFNLSTPTPTDKQQQEYCQELAKTHLADISRHSPNSLIRNHLTMKRRQNKQGGGNMPTHIQQLQQQQSEMLLSVLSDLKKRKGAMKRGPGDLAMFRVGNGLNGQEQVPIRGAPEMMGIQLVQNVNSTQPNLTIEGISSMAQKKLNFSNMTKHEQLLQQQFFSRIENKSPDTMFNPSSESSEMNYKQQEPPENIIRNQCSIILAMISNNVAASHSQDQDDSSNSQLNAEQLLSQLSDIVTKCRLLLRETTQSSMKGKYYHVQQTQQLAFQGNSQLSFQPQTATATLSHDNSVSGMIARKESPLKIIKSVLESRLVEMTNQVMIGSEKKTRDTIKIYEDLLTEITLALENIKNGSSGGNEEGGQKEGKISKMNTISPKVFTNAPKKQIFSKDGMKSPFMHHKHHGQKPKITIYHQPFNNLDQHPINLAIQKINYIIRLIFKQGNVKEVSGSLTAQQQLEEAKLSEIQRMSKVFNILIPKRFESKVALREYIQSKEFLVALKTRINTLLYTAINDSNCFTQADLAYIQGGSIPPPLQSQTSNVGQSAQESNYQVSQQKFFVGRGNNNALVRSVLKQRSWWVQYIPQNGGQVQEDEVVSEVSFIWTQWKRQKIIDYLAKNGEQAAVSQSINKESLPLVSKNSLSTGPRLRIYNKMEQNKQLTNKKGIFINMREYYKKLGQDPFEVLPLTFLIKAGETQGAEFRRFTDQFAEIAQVTKQREAQRQEALTQRYKELEAIRKEQNKGRPPLRPAKNGNKSPMRNNEYYDEADDDEGGYASGRQSPDDPYEDFDRDEQVREIKRRYKVPKNVWIVKPGENTNRGIGINVSQTLMEIKSLVSQSGSYSDNGVMKEKTFIVQKYIDHPLLIHNRKFDFRCYGLMTSINGHLKGYFYEDAYIRTSCKEFDISNLDNKYIHLTNDAVQKNSMDYGKYENGNKMSLHDFQKYLRHLGNVQTNPNGDSYYANIDVFRDLMPQIRKLVTDSYRAVYGKIDPGRLKNSFEIFGYDFMLDEDFKLSLIEVNTNPCLEISCPLLARIIPELLDNVFR